MHKTRILFFLIITGIITTSNFAPTRAYIVVSKGSDISNMSEKVLHQPLSKKYIKKLQKQNADEKVLINKSNKQITVQFIKDLSNVIKFKLKPNTIKIVKYSGPNFEIDKIIAKQDQKEIPSLNINSASKFIFNKNSWESY